MADGINVGSVEVSVVPEARDFNTRLRATIDPAANEAARQIADAISKGIRDGLSDPASTAPSAPQGTRAGDAFGTAFKNRVKAALSALPSAEVKLDDEAAQAKLDFLREELTSLSKAKVGVDISDTDAIARLTAIRAEMDNLASRSASFQVKADTAAASAQLDRFFAETQVKAKATGDKVGKSLSSGAAKSAQQGSPLIMAAITGGVLGGAPAIAAASLVAFGGISAAIAAQDPSVKAAFSGLMGGVKAELAKDGTDLAPTFDLIASHAGQAFAQIAPELRASLDAVAPEVLSVTDAIEGAAQTAMPAFTRALQQGQPIVQGLNTVIRDLGSGVAGLMDQVTAHAPAAGQDLADIGQIIGKALPIIGQLVGEGAQLGTEVLPVISGSLSVLGGTLNVVAPVLPEVAAGFLAWKVVSSLSGPLDTLSAKLQTIAADSGGLASTLSGRLAGAAAGLGSALPVVGVGIGLVAAALPALINFWKQDDTYTRLVTQSMQGLTQALQASKGAIDDNVVRAAALAAQQDGLFTAAKRWGVSTSTITQAVLGNADAMDQVQTAAGRYKGSLSALIPVYSNSSGAITDAQKRSDDWLAAIKRLAGGTDSQVQKQKDLQTAVEGATTAVANASPAEQTNATRLQQIANNASSASTQLNLFKGALDALTGKQVSLTQAEDAVTQAINAASTATQNQTGALVVGNDVMGTHTQRAAAAREALIQIAQSSNQVIATMEQQGKSEADVEARDGQLRDSFIQTAEKMGYSADQAHQLADQIYGIPSQRKTEIDADTQTAAKKLQDLQAQIDAMRGKNIQITVSAQGGLATYTTDQRNLLYSGTKATGGPIIGPGTGTSDTAGLFALSNNEWVVKAASALKYGPKAMASINDGTAAVIPGMAAGGPIGINVNLDETRVDSVVASLQKQLSASVGGSAGGAARWASLVLQALAMEGQPASLLGITLARMNQESGGNPNAINLWDSNAAAGDPSRGLMQTIGSTFARYHFGGTSWNIYDPLANVLASMNYALARYGSLAAAYGRVGGYDSGGVWPSGTLGYNGSGGDELVVPRQNFQQVVQSAGGSPGRSTGPLMQVQHMHVGDQVDFELALQQAEFRQRAGAFS